MTTTTRSCENGKTCITLFALVILMLGCSTDTNGMILPDADQSSQRGQAPTGADAGAPTDAGATEPPTSTVWTNSFKVGSGYQGDAGMQPSGDGAGNTLTGVGTTFSWASTGGTIYFQVTSSADIAGRSVVIYPAGTDPASANGQVVGSAAGPANGHVALGTFHTIENANTGTTIGSVLYNACLTTADRSKGGWNLGMVCTDFASALVTITP